MPIVLINALRRAWRKKVDILITKELLALSGHLDMIPTRVRDSFESHMTKDMLNTDEAHLLG